ncbi:MAG TPA: glutaredoxin family protein [Burkholderiales bacterium]|nr:glutaredoxin family protein [Burkholderiales bacterium]
MKFRAFLMLMAVAAFAHGADMYRWVDEKGVVNYTPYPPPPNIRKVEPKKLGDSARASPAPTNAPYSVQLAAKNFPVTFYSTPDCGEPCKVARAHLDKRGVPYADRNPSKPAVPQEFEDFKKLTGGGLEVPLLQVGQLKTLKGYLASDWDATLDAAGYPASAPPGSKPPAKPPADAAVPPGAAK